MRENEYYLGSTEDDDILRQCVTLIDVARLF